MENRIQDKKEAEEKTEKEADMMELKDDETSQKLNPSQRPDWSPCTYMHHWVTQKIHSSNSVHRNGRGFARTGNALSIHINPVTATEKIQWNSESETSFRESSIKPNYGP